MEKATKGEIIRIYIPELQIVVFGYSWKIGNRLYKSMYVVEREKIAKRHMAKIVNSHNSYIDNYPK